MKVPPDTLSLCDAPSIRGERRASQLYLTLYADQPLQAASRHSLADTEGVLLCRGMARVVARSGGRLRVDLADRWMSTRHAEIVPIGADGGWLLRDCGSKNGTFIAGKRIEQATLGDGDVIQLGQTWLVFRRDVPVREGELHDVEGGQLRPEAPLLCTLSPTLAYLFETLAKIAPTRVPVLVRGETGTGKEVIARAVHSLSKRPGPFVAVNCGALPATLVESELFGFKKGAFSGATSDRPGLVRSADGGTLFLDEIGDLPAPAQAALLRVLQEGEVHAIGATQAVKVDVRVVAATHRDLEGAMAREQFRADLFSRLRGFTVMLPPLRERREDLGVLVAAVLARHAPDGGEAVSFAPSAARALFASEWPHNIRELERRIQAAVVVAQDRPIEARDLFADPSAPDNTPGAQSSPRRGAPTAGQIEAALTAAQGNVVHAARALATHPRQLYRWIEKHAISLDKHRS